MGVSPPQCFEAWPVYHGGYFEGHRHIHKTGSDPDINDDDNNNEDAGNDNNDDAQENYDNNENNDSNDVTDYDNNEDTRGSTDTNDSNSDVGAHNSDDAQGNDDNNDHNNNTTNNNDDTHHDDNDNVPGNDYNNEESQGRRKGRNSDVNAWKRKCRYQKNPRNYERDELRVATWNVEGLSTGKLAQLQGIMVRQDIQILCIQETHISGATYYLSDGYLIILSGGDGSRERGGVGFVISPSLCSSIIGFHCKSNRLASLRVKVKGGSAGLITAYAPHSGYCFNTRHQFFHDLGSYIRRVNCHGPRLVFGDLNTRLNYIMPEEEEVLGPNVF